MEIETVSRPKLNLANLFNTNNQPFIIAGPCSAESRSQVLSTAQALSTIPQVKLYRAGLWKPRTRPGSFEGIGTEALTWLIEAQKETGLIPTVEVAQPVHVEACLKAGIQVLWIGARTTVSPFAVQELAEALRGTQTIILIKNPINPDLALWLGAIERIERMGILEIGAIHRGFSIYERGKYRNPPQWQIPIELMRRYPTLPIICDPSHIAGVRDWIPEIAQQALDLQMNGLMIETHINPAEALSDAQQQLTPAQLNQLIGNLKVRKHNFEDTETIIQLEGLRNSIDRIDTTLIELLAQRFSIAAQIGELKKNHNVAILQLERWDEILKHRLGYGIDLGLKADFLEKVWQLLHQAVIEQQNAQLSPEK